MVYHLTFEDMNQLMKHQIMSSSSSELSSCNISHVPLNSTRPQSLSENNLLMQCMQKLGQYPACNSRVVLQESNGQIMSTSSAKGEGGDDLHAGGGACTPRPRWCPTPEQIQVLETLFNSGTTTPSRDMIVEIAACLKQFGSIVEANVFYWFQNRKARAKRKLRMQAQLQQQQSASTSPADSDHPPQATAPITHNVLRVPPTSRRVCAKTTSKTSPNAFPASDHQLPALVHLPASVNHVDQCPAATYSLLSHDQHTTASCNMVMQPSHYAAGDCTTSLQIINNASSSKIISSSNAELSSCTTIPKKKSFSEHALHQGISQAMPSMIISHVPPPLSDHEGNGTDLHYNNIQNHIECDQYIKQMSSFSTAARASSRPGSADGANVMISSCSMLQHSEPPESAAAHSAAIINSHLYHAAAPSFIENPSQNHTELSAASHYHGEQHYSSTPAAYTSTSTSTSSYSDQLESSSFSLPNKRSWMEALMQHFVLSQDSTCNTSSTTTNNVMHNLYNDMDHYIAKAHTNEILKYNSIHSNLLLQQPQTLNSSQDAPRHASIYSTPITNLPRHSMEPTHSSIGAMKEANNGIDTKQHILASSSSPSHAAYHELHDAVTKRDSIAMETLMCSNTTLTSQQQAAYATSPPMFHHCDHLPLWEALAPYMSIGS